MKINCVFQYRYIWKSICSEFGIKWHLALMLKSFLEFHHFDFKLSCWNFIHVFIQLTIVDENFMLHCLQKIEKTHGLRTQKILKKVNKIQKKPNSNVYIHKMINYKLALLIQSNFTKWKQFFTLVQLFLVRLQNQYLEVTHQKKTQDKKKLLEK